MIRMTVHSSRLADVCLANRTDWIDIGYEKLGAAATYKVVLFNVGVGATPPVYLRNYPRWSASLWDLIVRAIVLASDPEQAEAQEKALKDKKPIAPEVLHQIEMASPRRCAFALAMSAVVEHHPSSGPAGRRLATMEITRHQGRGTYRARVQEDLWANTLTEPFAFTPKFLRPVDLVVHGALMRLTGSTAALPARPTLLLPEVTGDAIVDGKQYLVIDRMKEPARTGFLRWLHRNSEPPTPYPGLRDGLAAPTLFAKFIEVAV